MLPVFSVLPSPMRIFSSRSTGNGTVAFATGAASDFVEGDIVGKPAGTAFRHVGFGEVRDARACACQGRPRRPIPPEARRRHRGCALHVPPAAERQPDFLHPLQARRAQPGDGQGRPRQPRRLSRRRIEAARRGRCACPRRTARPAQDARRHERGGIRQVARQDRRGLRQGRRQGRRTDLALALRRHRRRRRRHRQARPGDPFRAERERRRPPRHRAGR